MDELLIRREKAELRRDETAPEGWMFAAIRRMEALRSAHPVFDTAADLWLPDTGSDQVLGIGRYCRGEKLLALFNFADRERTACFASGP